MATIYRLTTVHFCCAVVLSDDVSLITVQWFCIKLVEIF